MSYPDPYYPQQQPAPGPYPPAPPGPQGYGYPPNGYPPNGGYPPAQPYQPYQAYQPYGAQQQPPYYPSPTNPPSTAERDNGTTWQVLDSLLFLFNGRSMRGFGNNPRDRVVTWLAIVGITVAAVAVMVLIGVLASR